MGGTERAKALAAPAPQREGALAETGYRREEPSAAVERVSDVANMSVNAVAGSCVSACRKTFPPIVILPTSPAGSAAV
ncbi:MAG: hypothetical protein ACREP1_12935 [Rhodanobacteraceae bacterium]